MTVAKPAEQIYWSATRDRDGNREYTIRYLVVCSSKWDGPEVVSGATGLPLPGAPWAGPYVRTNDRDMDATCTPYLRITPHQQIHNEGIFHWIVEKKFSTNPIARCQDVGVANPLKEPARISGSFARHVEELTEGWNEGFTAKESLLTSSHEPIRGPKVEFESNYPTVTIEQTLDWSQFNMTKLAELQNHVNEGEMWGQAARTVKLTHSSWVMMYWAATGGYQCSIPYYQRSCTFEINAEGWDRQVDDEGTRALGYWDPRDGPKNATWVTEGDPDNVGDFNRYRDKYGELDHALLDGSGAPLGDGAERVKIDIRGYNQADLFQLWLPEKLYDPNSIVRT